MCKYTRGWKRPGVDSERGAGVLLWSVGSLGYPGLCSPNPAHCTRALTLIHLCPPPCLPLFLQAWMDSRFVGQPDVYLISVVVIIPGVCNCAQAWIQDQVCVRAADAEGAWGGGPLLGLKQQGSGGWQGCEHCRQVRHRRCQWGSAGASQALWTVPCHDRPPQAQLIPPHSRCPPRAGNLARRC